MWMYLPYEFFPYAPGLVLWSLDCDSFTTTATPLLTARGTTRGPRYWRNAWTREHSTQRPSGQMFPLSPEGNLLAKWTSSWPDSPASPSLWPDENLGLPITAGSGQTSLVSFGRWDPESSSWRMLPDLFGTGSELSSGTWPKRGSMRSGELLLRPKSEHLTSESGSSSWPTPVAKDDNKSPEAHLAMKERMGGNRTEITSLQVAVKQWPTPASSEIKGSAKVGQRRGQLSESILLWQTPQTDSFRSRGGDRKDEPGLDRQSKNWSTPIATMEEKGGDYRRGNPTLKKQARDSFHPDQTMPADGSTISDTRPKLNPRFVSRLMGIPDDWTSSSSSATELSPWLRRMRTALLQLVSPASN